MPPLNSQVIAYLNFVNSAYLMYKHDSSSLTPPTARLSSGVGGSLLSEQH